MEMSDELYLDIQSFQPSVLPTSHHGSSAIRGRTSVTTRASSDWEGHGAQPPVLPY